MKAPFKRARLSRSCASVCPSSSAGTNVGSRRPNVASTEAYGLCEDDGECRSHLQAGSAWSSSTTQLANQRHIKLWSVDHVSPNTDSRAMFSFDRPSFFDSGRTFIKIAPFDVGGLYKSELLMFTHAVAEKHPGGGGTHLVDSWPN